MKIDPWSQRPDGYPRNSEVLKQQVAELLEEGKEQIARAKAYIEGDNMANTRFDWIAEDTKSDLRVHWFETGDPGGSVKFDFTGGDEILLTREEWNELKDIVEECFDANADE